MDTTDSCIDLNCDSGDEYIKLPKISDIKPDVFYVDKEPDRSISRPMKETIKWKEYIGTVPCISVYASVRCPHGDKCCYAHSRFDFRPKNCVMKDRCSSVTPTGYHTYRNIKYRKTCGFLHPYESMDSICARLSIPDKPKNMY